ncbi:MAG: tRNA(Ile)(2)-agmatinylcytidine synthase [Methanothrix sp.]|jgi:tRNA(Ile2)-agmatinylcytidine synthase|uniref:tRNA(Ile2) 2-agmatinylcytidine synthetase TiaS n=1 Tax=Methanothrix harundinacea TaxID=301375 RepID=A0A101ILC0_9EURY|nr:MAG: tRNA(Ile2) 2-agmatinylcytidine synthetase [Methanosaeta sp. SDB]KUK44908.1 MAG: tRNA(Ile2) 2-agmatinylcytidine synthetase TiaS [Methanothrix harundinacea]MDD3710857.1 tRNA(Ile)(2)-agmatinylcytidine synthase [Methanothrix sp.]MDI9398040.1 tRNA(Ile)(2)-agmatinylcytidine synthase [Euryarchaeota archaeon]KUK97266.1 MAG: tRNA(Ile2) 2-agmatinylcytidine synthetase TiaS [Methanothrix harundinacea]
MITIGVDDTDSEEGLCTTYLAAVMMERLAGLGEIRGSPRLVRLNPCVQFKTRGNAAIAFSLDTDRPEEAKEVALNALMELSDFSGPNTNPGLVVAEEIPAELSRFYRRALDEVLEIQEAEEIINRYGLWSRSFKNRRGLIGALAAMGAEFEDWTYELLAYREPRRWGTDREIDEESVWRADELTYPGTWDTVDHHHRKVIFAPHSKDPVLFGIRGQDPDLLRSALRTIRSEPPERTVIYRTNQGTDVHINEGEIPDVIENRSYRLRGIVAKEPETIGGGHLFFPLASEDGKGSISCAAFEPTKNFRERVRALAPGDVIEVYGAVKKRTLNIEKMEIVRLTERRAQKAPICPSCHRRMKSAGQGQGYRCRRCGTKADGKVEVLLPREIKPGFYEVPPCARRHLSKPLVRMRNGKVYPSR